MRALFGNLIFIIYAIGFLIIWGSILTGFNIDDYTPENMIMWFSMLII
ncbi:hypothetical protein N581_10335 [Lactobacillus jensenii MD IIE-70(2)]|nr:hypothetical protein N581_10335 [Lactobacillus jensenii MD IIE-70(2)]